MEMSWELENEQKNGRAFFLKWLVLACKATSFSSSPVLCFSAPLKPDSLLEPIQRAKAIP